MGLASWVLYVVVYTPLKTRSPLNTTVGAVAGAIPLLMGWTATGAPLNLTAWSLAGVLFLWQFPHFMAIAWLYRRDYAAAGHRMLSVVDPTGVRCGVQAVIGAALLIPVSLIPALDPTSGSPMVYGLWAIALGAVQLALAIQFALRRDERSRPPAAARHAVVPAGLADDAADRRRFEKASDVRSPRVQQSNNRNPETKIPIMSARPHATPTHGHGPLGHAPHGGLQYQPALPIPNGKTCLWLFLSTEIMFFAGLIGAYIVLRFGAAAWPRDARRPPGRVPRRHQHGRAHRLEHHGGARPGSGQAGQRRAAPRVGSC